MSKALSRRAEESPASEGMLGEGNGSAARDVSLQLAWRMLLSTDATVVRVLEAWTGEAIRTAGLSQSTRARSPADLELDVDPGASLLERATLLQGERTGHNYVYAEALIAVDRLDARLRGGLLSTPEPIGRLLVGGRVETFRELLRSGGSPAGERATWFGVPEGELVPWRTYRILIGGRPAMLITEHFSPKLFGPEAPSPVSDAESSAPPS